VALNLGKGNDGPVGTEYYGTKPVNTSTFPGQGANQYCLYIHTDQALTNGLIVDGGPALLNAGGNLFGPGGAGIIAIGGPGAESDWPGEDDQGPGPGIVAKGGTGGTGNSDGIQAQGNGTGAGITSWSESGKGVYAKSINDIGVLAESEGGPGLVANGGANSAGVDATGVPGVNGVGLGGTATGVAGSSENGSGVVGLSRNGRGGVFSSYNVAQLRLEPSTTPLQDNVQLLNSGQIGDLYLSSESISRGRPIPSTTLWLCVLSAEGGKQSAWAPIEIQLSGIVGG
jgi:hypothetical protein